MVVLLGSNPARHQVVPHGIREGEIVIPRGRHIPILDQREMEMPIEVFLHRGDVFHIRNASHTDLLALVDIWLQYRHGYDRVKNTKKLTQKDTKQTEKARKKMHSQGKLKLVYFLNINKEKEF